ncbi:MAG: two-component regulator propeller domain-containing protein, partial [Bacteroidota bacterium]
MYFGNTDGLLIYDGTQWRMKFLPNRSAVRAIKGDQQNNLYVGGENEFGKFVKDSGGRLEYTSYTSLLPDSLERVRNIWQIFIHNDSIVFQERNKLFIFNDDQLIDVIKTKYQFFWGFKHNDQLFFFEAGRGMTRLTEGRTRLVPNGQFYENHTPRALFRWSEDTLLFASPIDGLAFYDGKEFTYWDIPVSDFIVENRLYSGTQLSENLLALGTQNAGVMIMNKEGEAQELINKENGLQNNMVFDMMQDNHGNLWLGLANGISFLNLNSPFRYYTEKYGIPKQNYYVTKHEGNLYFSNDVGVYSKPWSDLSSDLTIHKAKLLEGSKGQSWLFQKAGEYLLCGHNNGVLVIKDNEVKEVLPVPTNVWEIIKDPFKENLYLACSTEGVYFLQFTGDEVKVRNKLKGFDENISFSAFDTTGHLWVSNEVDGIYRLKIDEKRDTVLNIDHYTTEDGLPSKEGNWVYRFDGKMVITHPNHFGIYKYNSETDSIESHEKLNEKFQVEGAVTLLSKDPQGNCWIRDDGMVKVFRPKEEGKGTKLVEKPFQKFESRNLERISYIDSIYVFFGTDEYVLNYCRNYDYDLDKPYSAH